MLCMILTCSFCQMTLSRTLRHTCCFQTAHVQAQSLRTDRWAGENGLMPEKCEMATFMALHFCSMQNILGHVWDM